jgi:putative transposase
VSQNRIHRLFGVSKGTSYYQKQGYPKSRKQSPQKDEAALAVLKEISRKRPTYGCPRVRAIAKRDFGLSLTSHKVYRLMKDNGLLLRNKGTRNPPREHTGKVCVPNSNTRWASDLTQIRLWDGTRLRFTYILDCCDRSIISYRLGRYMWAVDVEQMVQEALLKRFGQLPAPHALEFLHDNGPEYLEHALQKQLKEWNIKNCNTPTYSPQSNGMCEAFNGTFKRDYVYQACLDSEEEVRKMIHKWVKDYNTFAPHSALGMKTPTEYFNLKLAA